MPEVLAKGKIQYGEEPARAVSARAYGGIVADTTALGNISVKTRAHGMVAVVAPSATWVFDAASVLAAGATVVQPAAGSGRWLKTT